MSHQLCFATEALSWGGEPHPFHRGHGIVTSVERVRTTLNATKNPGRDAIELAGTIEAFTSERLTRAR